MSTNALSGAFKNSGNYLITYFDYKDVGALRGTCRSLRAHEGLSANKSFRVRVSTDLFLGLGRLWWKQVIERAYHSLGPDVFDKGLHGKPPEPGFLSNLRKGATVIAASGLFHGDPLTVDLYRKVHRVSVDVHRETQCTVVPFQGSTNLSPFRQKGMYTSVMDEGFREYMSEEIDGVPYFELVKTDIQEQSALLGIAFIGSVGINLPIEGREVCYVYSPDKYFGDDDHRSTSEQIEDLFGRVIDLLNKSLASAKTPPEKLLCIARHFQFVAHLRPFDKAVGRVNLLVVNALLSIHGFHPISLEQPMRLSFETLDGAVEIFEEGLRNWEAIRKESQKPPAKSKLCTIS